MDEINMAQYYATESVECMKPILPPPRKEEELGEISWNQIIKEEQALAEKIFKGGGK